MMGIVMLPCTIDSKPCQISAIRSMRTKIVRRMTLKLHVPPDEQEVFSIMAMSATVAYRMKTRQYASSGWTRC